MRKTLLTLALAASALTAATAVCLADDCDSGYSTGYSSSGSYRVSQTYSRTTYYDCRTVSYRVWDDYSQTYIYRTREVCN
jgi:hypothetical protein